MSPLFPSLGPVLNVEATFHVCTLAQEALTCPVSYFSAGAKVTGEARGKFATLHPGPTCSMTTFALSFMKWKSWGPSTPETSWTLQQGQVLEGLVYLVETGAQINVRLTPLLRTPIHFFLLHFVPSCASEQRHRPLGAFSQPSPPELREGLGTGDSSRHHLCHELPSEERQVQTAVFPRTSGFGCLQRRWDSGCVSRAPISLAQAGPGLEVP